jgi:transposase-like protein
MWTEKDDKGSQRYVCKLCGSNRFAVFKEPMARKPRASGSRVRITVRCKNAKCKLYGKSRRVGWLTHG